MKRLCYESSMNTWIALLRGINVGGNNIVPMKNLRMLLEGLNFLNVRTYIQSGNCVFECEVSDPSKLATAVTEKIGDEFGFRPEVMLVSKGELQAAIADNPYPEGADDPKSVHLFFLSQPTQDPDLESLRAVQKPSERFSLSDRVFYLLAPEGLGHSKLAAKVEKALRVPVTARNLRSAQKIAELAG